MLQRLTSLKGTSRKMLAIFAPAVVSWLLTAFSIFFLRDYGLGVFIFVPLFIGITSTILIGYRQKLLTREYLSITTLSLVTYCIGLILFAMEGAICIVMAAPLGLLIAYIGTAIGVGIVNKYDQSSLPVIIGLAALIPSLMSFESMNPDSPELFSVRTSVVINQSPEKVWKQVVTFSRIEEPEEWLFRAGIAYPTDAKIDGTGKGATRYCNFSTGCFVEPITTWQEPSLLQFSVRVTPEPLKEISPYNIEPAHLHGYFVSEQGQFKLTRLAGNRTLLEGTTWYHHKIQPAFYWKFWSNYIIHKIHNRVLQHIRKEAEKEPNL
jgi:hypothetical protein